MINRFRLSMSARDPKVAEYVADRGASDAGVHALTTSKGILFSVRIFRFDKVLRLLGSDVTLTE
jgi:hypothetical protein